MPAARRGVRAWGAPAAFLLAASCGGASDGPPKNLLLVVLDTTRADHLSTYGYGEETSPHLTDLARAGARFDAVFAQSSLTPVSAGSFLTGTLPVRHGVRSLFQVSEEKLADDVTTLAEHLEGAGMQTAGFVSAAPMNWRYGLDRGFSTYSDKFGAKADVPCGNAYQRRADETTELALEWLAGNGLDPFFVLVHYFDAHDANLAPPREFLEPRVSFPLPRDLDRPCSLMRLADPLKVELYDAEIAFMDSQLGRLLERIERLGVLEDTLVVVVADHGEGLGDHGNWTHGWLHREQLRVPLVMTGPGVPRGEVFDQRVRLMDLAPTVLDLFGLDTGAAVDASSFGPLLAGRSEKPRDLYAEVHHPVEDRLRRDPEMYTLTIGTWKYIHRPVTGDHELYELTADPYEERNVFAADHPRALALRRELERMSSISGLRLSTDDVDPSQRDELEALGYLGPEEDEGD